MEKLLLKLFLSLGGVAMVVKFAVNNEPSAIHAAFGWLLKIPAASAFIKANAPLIKKILDTGVAAVDTELDQTQQDDSKPSAS